MRWRIERQLKMASDLAAAPKICLNGGGKAFPRIPLMHCRLEGNVPSQQRKSFS
jgi:hypothetical protein